MATLIVSPKFQAFDANGDPLNGGYLYTYVANSTTPKDTYTTRAGGVANTNPVQLDTRGEADVWLDGDALYKFVLKDSAGATIWTVDNVGPDVSTGPSIIAADYDTIQEAIDAAAARGGGFVELAAGTHAVSTTLIQPSKVILRGQGSAVTTLRAANGLNADVIQSEDYATLTGTDTWLIADGHQYGLGLMHLKIDGNKANNTSGNGVSYYAKKIIIEDVMIVQCNDEGLHSESNYSIPGTPSSVGDDMPEGRIKGLYVWECGSHGVMWRGQHDTVIESLFSGLNGGWGIRFETDASAPTVYSGNCDSKFMHIYANQLGGVYIDVNASHQGAFMICESNCGVGLQCDGWQVKIGTLQLYLNNGAGGSLFSGASTGSYQAVIAGNECQFGKIHSKSAKAAKAHVSITGDNNVADITVVGAAADGASGSVGGVSITGANNRVAVTADGNASAGIGLDIDDNANRVEFHVEGYSATGGIGVRTNNGGAKIGCDISGYILNCKTLWNNVTAGNLNHYRIRGFANAGQTIFSGVGPPAADESESWDVQLYNTDTTITHRSTIRGLSTSDIDLNSTAEQEITESLTALFGLTPDPEDVRFNLYYTGTNTAFAVQYFKLHSVSSSEIKWRIKLSTAAGGAAAAKIAYEVTL